MREHYDKRYKGYRIYFAGFTNGICVDNPQGIRIIRDTNPRTAKLLIKALIKENK